MRNILFGAALAALLAPAALALGAHAADPAASPPAPDWRRLGRIPGITLDWDAAAVERGDTLFVLVRATPPTPGNTHYAYSITRMEMRCTPAEGRAIQTVNYRPDGTAGGIDNSPVPFEPIAPGTLFDPLHSVLCPAPAPAAPPPH